MNSEIQQERQRLRALLRQLREDAGFRQIDLAEKLGKPQSYISKYETGEKNLNLLEAKKICEVLKVRLSDFAKKIEKQV